MLATLMLSWIVLCGVLCGSFAEETGFDYLRTKLGSWVKSIPTFTTPSTSTQGKPLTTGMDVYGGYYLEYAVAPTNSDCSGPVASIVGGKLNLCMVRDKKGFMGECGIDADKLYIQTLVYPNSLTCDSTDIPEIGHFVHYGCTGSGSAIPNTYSKSDCTNSTAEQVVGSVKGLSFKLYGTGHTTASCASESELTSFAAYNADYCSEEQDQTYGTVYRKISCSKSQKRIITSFYSDNKCTMPGKKPGKNLPVPPFGGCYDASLLIPNSEQKMIPMCSFA